MSGSRDTLDGMTSSPVIRAPLSTKAVLVGGGIYVTWRLVEIVWRVVDLVLGALA